MDSSSATTVSQKYWKSIKKLPETYDKMYWEKSHLYQFSMETAC